MSAPRRYRAPSEDGAVLAVPPLAEAVEHLTDHAARRDRWSYDVQGRSMARVRAMARSEVVDRARAFHREYGLTVPDVDPARPIVASGHQPELFHPGVWVKNFAVAGIARGAGARAVGLNLIVDNDTLKRASVRVPQGRGSVLVDFDAWSEEVPQEEQVVRDETLFADFGRRIEEALGNTVADPVIREYWPRALSFRDRTPHPGLRLALARHVTESAWGYDNLELPLSSVCETEGFLWFASHLLAHLERFREVHNAELADYRRAHRIRSTHHPVADLNRQGDWIEAPFWAWRAEKPRRRPLLARAVDDKRMELRISGEDQPFLELPLGPEREACCAVERLRELPARRIRLRTRALSTTMFSRLVLSDLFLHGIGGAKYDELGDAIVRRFFQVEPPGFLTLSMTLHLNPASDPVPPGRPVEVERRIRDLTFNPDRHLTSPLSQGVDDVVEAKRAAILGPVGTRRQRVERFHAIRRANEALQPSVEERRRELEEERNRLDDALKRNAVARNREYALVLHSSRRLREVFREVVLTAEGHGSFFS